MELCIAEGGTITGEHGVGLDKLGYMERLFSADSLDAMCRLRDAFDPERRANPGKAVPSPRRPERSAAVAPDAEVLDVSAISGIVEYVPGDLTITARSGTTIAELDSATSAHGQWCPLLPWGGDVGTLGATFATA